MLYWIEAYRQCRILYRVNDKSVLQVGRKGSHQHPVHLVIGVILRAQEKREERQAR